MIYDPGELTSYRAGDGSVVKIEYYKKLASTTELAREYALAGTPDRFVVFAEEQTTSPIIGTKLADGTSEKGVFLSLILRPSFFPSQAGLLGPLATVALVNAFEEHTTETAGIGWVTDVLYKGKKIGGCVIEGKLNDYSSYEYLIVSFALKLDNNIFSPRLTDIIRKVFDNENPSVAMLIARTILNKFFIVYSDLKNPAKHMNSYKQKFSNYGKRIVYIKDGKKCLGKIFDVDKSNCILLVTDSKGETHKISSPSSIVTTQRFGLFNIFG